MEYFNLTFKKILSETVSFYIPGLPFLSLLVHTWESSKCQSIFLVCRGTPFFRHKRPVDKPTEAFCPSRTHSHCSHHVHILTCTCIHTRIHRQLRYMFPKSTVWVVSPCTDKAVSSAHHFIVSRMSHHQSASLLLAVSTLRACVYACVCVVQH